MAYYRRVEGRKCYLSPIDPDASLTYVEWLNDPELALMLQVTVKPVSIAAEREFIDKDPSRFSWILLPTILTGQFSRRHSNRLAATP